jgi:hypothetical protein
MCIHLQTTYIMDEITKQALNLGVVG